MKAIINYLSDPVFSFTGIIIGFLFAIKYVEIFASKKFASIALVFILLVFLLS